MTAFLPLILPRLHFHPSLQDGGEDSVSPLGPLGASLGEVVGGAFALPLECLSLTPSFSARVQECPGALCSVLKSQPCWGHACTGIYILSTDLEKLLLERRVCSPSSLRSQRMGKLLELMIMYTDPFKNSFLI